VLNKPQISVVDDDQHFRDSMRRLLNSLDYAVSEYSSASDFLSSPKHATTACLVSDIRMPAMTGVELYKQLINKGKLIPTILVTAYPDDAERDQILAMGVKCYLCKPLVETVFIDCLRSCVTHGNGVS
jgi:FixJ family two-component response regulator